MAENYSNMKKAELVQLCKEKGLSVKANLSNKELIKLLQNEADFESSTGKKKAEKKVEKKEDAENVLKEKAFGEGEFKPKLYRDSPEMLTINSEDRFKRKSPSSKEDEELRLSFADPSKILSGEVIGVENSETGKMAIGPNGERVNVVYAKVGYGTREVLIPSLLFFENAADIPNDKVYQYMQDRIFSWVDFSVINIDEAEDGTPKFYGTRIGAQKRKRCDYWYSRAKASNVRDPKDYPYLIEDGQIVEAKVVAVSKHVMFVEVFGAEARVHSGDVAYEMVNDVREYYAPGDKVAIKVTDIVRNDTPEGHNTGYPVTFKASHKDAIEDPRKQFFRNYKMHSTYRGKVTKKILTKKNLVFFVNTGQLDVHCVMAEGVGMIPDEGDYVTFKIKGYQEETFRLWGDIIHVFPKKRSGGVF